MRDTTVVAFARSCSSGIETAIAFAGAGRASTETVIAFAGEKRVFLVRLSAAVVMPVSAVLIAKNCELFDWMENSK